MKRAWRWAKKHWLWTGIGLVVIVALLALGLALSPLEWHWQMGTVGEWAAGIFTLAAVVAALWLGWRQLSQERLHTRVALEQTELSLALAEEALAEDRERSRRQIEDQERSQAALVSCMDNGIERSGDLFQQTFACFNDSPAAVFSVAGFVVFEDTFRRGEALKVLPTGQPAQGVSVMLPALHESTLARPAAAGITFNDGAGRRWMRLATGELRRFTDDQDAIAWMATIPAFNQLLKRTK